MLVFKINKRTSKNKEQDVTQHSFVLEFQFLKENKTTVDKIGRNYAG